MSQTLNCKELKEELLNNLRPCLEYLLPNGTFHGHEFRVGSIRGEKGESLRVELTGDRKGLWRDFATNDKGDIINLWATVKGKNARAEFIEVMASLAEWLGKKDVKEYKSFEYLEKYLICSWNYYDENNQVIVIVSRFDPPGRKKEYRPFDVKTLSYGAPDIRPLYNIPGILKSDKVVLVEGEKCAEALIKHGITATTAMSGANADANKTDWTPLKGKHIIIWPDNDEVGKKYAKNVGNKLLEIGVASLAVLEIPQDKPEKWDAADYVQESANVSEFIEKNSRKVIIRSPLNILDWNAERFVGPAPEQKFLVEGMFPFGVTSIVAAMWDTGKGCK